MYYGYVYKTTNTITGQIYIGKRQRDYRLGRDKNYLGSGTMLKADIKRYGTDVFNNEIIEWCKTAEEADERERYWIKKLNALYIYGNYNMTKGGTGGGCVGFYNNQSRIFSDKSGENNPFYGCTHNEKTKRQISKTKKGTPPPNKGKKYTEEEKQKIYYNKTFNIVCKRCEAAFIAKASGYKWCGACKIKNQIDDNNKVIKQMLPYPSKSIYVKNRRKKNKGLLQKLKSEYGEEYKSL